MSTSSNSKAQTASDIVELLATEAQRNARQTGTDDGFSFDAGIAASRLIEGYMLACEANERLQSPEQVAFDSQGADGRLIEHAATWACKHAYKLAISGRTSRLIQEAGRSREFSLLFGRTFTADPEARARARVELDQAVDPLRRKAERAFFKELSASYSLNLREEI